MDAVDNFHYVNPVNQQQGPVRKPEDLLPLRLMQEPPLTKFTPEIGLRVLSTIMNALVVQFCIGCKDDLESVNDITLAGYVAVHHMLLYLADADSRWREIANLEVKNFIENPAHRRKNCCRDIGR